MRRAFCGATMLLATIIPAGAQPDPQCLAAMQRRAEACTNDCMAKARAAVDATMQDKIYGRACAKNCLKGQMFQRQVCS